MHDDDQSACTSDDRHAEQHLSSVYEGLERPIQLTSDTHSREGAYHTVQWVETREAIDEVEERSHLFARLSFHPAQPHSPCSSFV
jgi:hypothetical protein